MARSLSVTHDEKPATSYLLNMFLVLAFGWLLLASVAGAVSPDAQVGGSAPTAAIAD